MYEKIALALGLLLIAGVYGLLFYGILFHSVLSRVGKAIFIWFFTAITPVRYISHRRPQEERIRRMKSLVALLDLYAIIMCGLSILVATPLVWTAISNHYYGALAVIGVWTTFLLILFLTLLGAHSALAASQKKHDA